MFQFSLELVKITSCLSQDEIEDTLEIIVAVKRYAYDTALIPQSLNRDIGLQAMTKLFFHSARGRVQPRGGGREGRRRHPKLGSAIAGYLAGS